MATVATAVILARMTVPAARRLVTFLLLIATGAGARADRPPAAPEPPFSAASAESETLPAGIYARFETAHGTIIAELFARETPLTVANFVGLAEGTITSEGRPAGQPFFDGLTFHRVVDGFVVQGGDPLGTGEGGPGYTFQDEFTPQLKHDSAGVLAMANDGPNTNGSQFYFTLNATNRLDYKHAVFGRVVQGFDVLALIRAGDVMNRVRILRSGPEAEVFRPDDSMFVRLRETTPRIPPRHAALPRLFVDAARLDLPAFYPDWLNERLHHFAEVRGVSIYVRTLPRLDGVLDAAAESAALAVLHEELAQRDPRSATLLYTSEDRAWRLWLGDGLFGPLGATPDRVVDVKAAILAGAVAQTEAGFPRRAIDAAVTDLIGALDRAEHAGR